MNLKSLSMLPDDIGPLGPPIRREQTKPAPAPTVEHRPDGTLTTNPDGTMSFEPRVAESLPQPVWPFPTSTDPEPGAHGFMREPLKVGDRVRLLVDYVGLFKTGDVLTVSSLGELDFWADAMSGRSACLGYAHSPSGSVEGEAWERVQ